jgi:hypothetical protein
LKGLELAGGWRTFGSVFNNQGDCRQLATGSKTRRSRRTASRVPASWRLDLSLRWCF